MGKSKDPKKDEGLEGRYYHLYQNATDGLFTVDHEGYLHDANKTCERITGYSSKELEQTHYSDLLAPKEKRFISHYFEMIKKGQLIPRDDVQVDIITKNRQNKVIELHIQNASFNEGLIQASIRDVTDKKKLEEQLINAQRMECIGKLVNDVSHKFNDILTGILGSASYLRDSLKGHEEYYKHVETIEKSASVGADLVSQLMAFGNRQESHSQVININEVIQDAISLMHNNHITNRIEVIAQLEQGPSLARLDKSQVMQVVMNICHNAKDAMPNGGKLTIVTKSLDLSEDFCLKHIGLSKERKYVHIEISDTGHGIEEKWLPYIFDPFFTTKDVGKGTGLGLSVAFGIIKAHQGTILVRSKLSAGTTFDIYLPACSSSTVKEDGFKVSEGEGTVMIVEDEELVRRMTLNILKRSGYSVLCAADGEEALVLYKKNENLIDLVILDMIMPKKDGLETFKQLKEINQNIRVVISTGYLPNHISSQFLKGGAVGFIQKPYTAMELSKMVKRVLS